MIKTTYEMWMSLAREKIMEAGLLAVLALVFFFTGTYLAIQRFLEQDWRGILLVSSGVLIAFILLRCSRKLDKKASEYIEEAHKAR